VQIRHGPATVSVAFLATAVRHMPDSLVLPVFAEQGGRTLTRIKYAIPATLLWLRGFFILCPGASATPMKKQITLIRHAAIADAWSGRYIGHRDVPLSDAGVERAQQLTQHLTGRNTQPIERLWCSPAQRARQTAQPLSQRLECPVTIDIRLHEIDFGQWEGLTFAQIQHQDPHRVDQWAAFADTFCFPGGEALPEFHQRVNAVVAAIHAEDCGHLAIVSHGGMLQSLLCALLGWPLQDHLKFTFERGSFATLQLEADRAVLTGLYNHDT